MTNGRNRNSADPIVGPNGARPKLADRFRDRIDWATQVFLLMVAPGAGIRRWLLLGAVGGVIFSVGIAYVVRYYTTVYLPDILPWNLEAILLMVGALGLAGVASLRLTDRIGRGTAARLPDETLRQSMVRLRQYERGPRVVAIGGGTGLSSLLRGMKEATGQITGVLTVGDDGGSSGRLRQDFGVLPPGDFRNCIVALADAEPLMKRLFQHRFAAGTGLEGHSFGNLFIVAMSEVTGTFMDAINESSRVLNVRGQLVPSTLENVTLVGRMADGRVIEGESAIPKANGKVDLLSLSPEHPAPYMPAVEAIRNAQMIVIGPGSLYTSILPNLLVKEIAEAIASSSALVVYVCNVATQAGETDGFTVGDHMRALFRHCPDLRIDYVLANSNMTSLQPEFPAGLVTRGYFDFPGARLVEMDLMNSEFRIHHDPRKLAAALTALYHESSRRNGKRGERQKTMIPRPVP
ncbi:MAG: YvcK family protein [Chloroflexi bacterium]|nr:YvcK family protein [Chloroflexota bacterium]